MGEGACSGLDLRSAKFCRTHIASAMNDAEKKDRIRRQLEEDLVRPVHYQSKTRPQEILVGARTTRASKARQMSANRADEPAGDTAAGGMHQVVVDGVEVAPRARRDI
jgi:hypothetical protein